MRYWLDAPGNNVTAPLKILFTPRGSDEGFIKAGVAADDDDDNNDDDDAKVIFTAISVWNDLIKGKHFIREHQKTKGG